MIKGGLISVVCIIGSAFYATVAWIEGEPVSDRELATYLLIMGIWFQVNAIPRRSSKKEEEE